MPLIEGFDKKENKKFVKFGASGAKYYYNPESEKSHQIAVSKAMKQAAAIHISKFNEKNKVVHKEKQSMPLNIKIKK